MCGGVCGVEGVWREGCFSLWECVVVGSGGVWLAGKGGLTPLYPVPQKTRKFASPSFFNTRNSKNDAAFLLPTFLDSKNAISRHCRQPFISKNWIQKKFALLHTYLSHTNCSPVNLIHVRNQIFYHLLHLFQHLPHLLHSHSEKHPSLHTPSTPHTPPHIL